MANVIRLKRASGSDPAASDLVSGEPAVRTDTGELFFKKDDGSVAKVSGAGGGPDFKYLALRNAANNGAASYPNADFTLVTSGTTTALTPTAANTLLVSVNGVIQKPNTGTSTPSSGFALSGSTIKFGANLSAAPDFILYQESGGIGEPSDETVSEAKLKVSNSPVNGYFLSAQSGNTGGLTWAAPVATSCTGNSATATALATARAINGVDFDGTAAITVTAAAGTLTGTTLKSTVVTSSLTSLGDLTSLTVTGDLVVDTSTLKVDSSNNLVGIGTASPSGGKLHVVGSGNTGIKVQVGSSSADQIYLGNTGGASSVGTLTNVGFNLIQNGGVALAINTSKKLGIGTLNPSSRFSIVDTTTFTAFASAVPNSTDCMLQLANDPSSEAINNHSSLQFGVNGGSHNRVNSISAVAESASNRKLAFSFCTDSGSNRNERLRISADGHVLPGADSSYNIGSNANRFANIYADTLYGDGSNLTGISAGATGGGSDEIFYENSQTITTDYTITSNKNAMSAGPITINSGVSVTVPSGSTYTIV